MATRTATTRATRTTTRPPASKTRKPAAQATKQRAKPAPRSKRVSRTLTDHDEIRTWAEQRGGMPAAVKGTSRKSDDIGMIRIDFPGYSGEGKLEPVDWDRWFEKFDESNLALIVEEKTARGVKSNFNKLIAREGSPRPSPGRRVTRMRTQASTRRPHAPTRRARRK